jgi:CcmD family protein
VKNYEFLFWAYNVIWIGLAVYIVSLVLRLKKVSSRLDRLERKLDDRDDA